MTDIPLSRVALLAAAALIAPAAGLCETPSPAPSAQAALLEDLPVVEAASLHTQTLQEAPSNVTLITEDEIRRYGYRTLGEALAGVRGFYLTDDRSYRYVGVRGFSLPGDYNTRFLVMVNGHAMTENVYSSNNYFGQDFGLDMDLVKRIEVIRGPSSALYGSNGMFATINVITKSPVEEDVLRASTETGSLGERKASVTSSINLGRGANLLVSGSVFNNRGQSLYFPEFDAPESNDGWARGVDGERGYHAFANLVWRNWSFTGLFSAREKHYPTPSYDTIFNDKGNKIFDSRDLVEAIWDRDIGLGGKLRWRLFYDQHEYRGRYDMALEDGIRDNRDQGLGNWAGTQLTYRFDLPRRFGALTVGSELNVDIRNLQRNFDLQPVHAHYLDVDVPDLSYAVFLQHEWQFRRGWTANLGLRFDESGNHGHFLSPRAALIYQRSPRTVFKIMSGIAFRNPNAYEQFYDDQGISQISNPWLRHERIKSLEAAVERKVSKRLEAIGTVYHYRLTGLIGAVQVNDGIVQYQNASRFEATGAEFELNAHPWKGLEAAGSAAVENLARTHALEAVAPNSPRVLLKFRAGFPLRHGRFSIGSSCQYMSERRTFANAAGEPVYLADFTVTSRLHTAFDLQFGVRNLFDRHDWDPASPDQGLDRLSRDGRNLYVKLIWHTRQ